MLNDKLSMFESELICSGYAKSTIQGYVKHIAQFNAFTDCAFFDHPFNKCTVLDFLNSFSNINTRRNALKALKLFFRKYLADDSTIDEIKYPKSSRKLPIPIDFDFLKSKISEVKNLKHRSILALALSCGLRVSEVVSIKLSHCDSNNMTIRICDSKNGKTRLVPLSDEIRLLLHRYFLVYKPNEWLFEGERRLAYSVSSAQLLIKTYIGADFHFHQLRHTCATYLLDNGCDLRKIQVLLGHSQIESTAIYTHVSTRLLQTISLPFADGGLSK